MTPTNPAAVRAAEEYAETQSNCESAAGDFLAGAEWALASHPVVVQMREALEACAPSWLPGDIRILRRAALKAHAAAVKGEG